ncbi:HAO1 [Branchiostoma lanceolatum]|uniref:HAO1 protein n=1 Tax=Branchiostoma lanceolatum TaxID=7740 RepID=A0A8J9Z4I4_BRALA|nr:HAO1 [Branchiostoma lanceolatum]
MSENVHPKATSVVEFEKSAKEKLSEFVGTYYSHPGEGGQTYRDNCKAFKRYRLVPRNLRDVYIRDTSVTVLGSKLNLPVAIAPTSIHKLGHPEAERATARGAASMNTAMVLSSSSLLMMYASLFHPPGAASMNTAMVLSFSSLLMMYVSLFHPPGAVSMNTAMVLSSSSLLMMYASLFHPPGAASMNTAMVLSSSSLLMMYASLFHPPGAASMNTAMVLSSSSLLMMYASLFHPPGAASMNTAMVLSSWSHCSLEQVAAAAPRGVRWFYLLFYRDRGRMKRLLERAERAGYTAIVLTVDTPLFPFSLRRKPVVYPIQFSLPNIWLDDVAPGLPGSAEHDAYLKKVVKEAATWEDVKWVKNHTRLPVVLKVIFSAEDARFAVNLINLPITASFRWTFSPTLSMYGYCLSIDALPDIVRAVGGEAEVYLDGGVRTGTDVLKALALGARCVFIGRPALWGLACNGAEGVQRVLQILKDELSMAMARAGCAKISDIQPSLVVHQSYYGVPPMAKY